MDKNSLQTNKKWLYVFSSEKGKQGWWLKITSADDLFHYQAEWSDYRSFSSDLKHYQNLQKHTNNDYTIVSHSRFGFWVKKLQKEYGFSAEAAYKVIQNTQLLSMLNVLAQTSEIYINPSGGFCSSLQCKTAFVRRANIDFPKYHEQDIHIARFPDGQHYYAYIGDMQVRDGDILKWDTYDEAFAQAQKYIHTKSQ